jgi:hypothetical protein
MTLAWGSGMSHRLEVFIAAVLLCCTGTATAAGLDVAAQGYLFAGGHYVNGPDGRYLSGHAERTDSRS